MFTESMIQTYTQAETFRQGLGIPRGAEIQCSFLAQGEYHRNYRFLHPVTAVSYTHLDVYKRQDEE